MNLMTNSFTWNPRPGKYSICRRQRDEQNLTRIVPRVVRPRIQQGRKTTPDSLHPTPPDRQPDRQDRCSKSISRNRAICSENPCGSPLRAGAVQKRDRGPQAWRVRGSHAIRSGDHNGDGASVDLSNGKVNA
jgi:hypothetical protein